MRVVSLLMAGLILALPLASGLAGVLPDATPRGEALIGYRDGTLAETRARVTALGASVTGVDERLGFLVAQTDDVLGLVATITAAPTVEYAEVNHLTRAHGAQWNGAQWNAAEMNGAQWNGAQWNEAEAEGAQWNGAQWNGEQWHSGPAFAQPDPGRGWQWGLERVRAPDAWNATKGTGSASLCVLDSGVDLDHPDLAANLWTGPSGEHGYNALEPSAAPDDDAGHGSHIAGIAAAVVGNGFGTAGVGNVEIIAVKVLNAQGTGDEADLATGLAWCADAGADVAVMALGVEDDGPTVRAAIAYAKQRDVLMLASAGNGGCDCVGFPARHADVIAVGAIGPGGNVTSFSSRGGALDLAAPGVEILSTFSDGGFRYGTGTSQAVAFAAGAAALVRDAQPETGASGARERLLDTAKDAGKPGWDSASGHGVVDVAAAIGE